MPWIAAMGATMTAFSGAWGTSFTKNLTPDKETGLGDWTVEQFIATMKTGKDRGKGRPVLPPMPVQNLAQLSDEDIRALFAYLQTLKPIKNRVPQPIDPPDSKRRRRLISGITALLLATVTKATAGFETEMTVPVAPQLLSETGLYAGEGTARVDPRNRPFSPQYPLWSDGAGKRRWIRLPEGAAIDATQPRRAGSFRSAPGSGRSSPLTDIKWKRASCGA